ncbi:lysosomal acid glucosylceramidase-like isoform X2 [Saccostrea echinata]|uniref:lysosomal acid glucosylceramidase-like isoform X2 n=1 Tax=Saccostrea echinata TaxID=191078 RepID=UPI002A8224C6|nr:lysosomal acid glucosylceramidase-like isoform X2 [Saccostrea echinata]
MGVKIVLTHVLFALILSAYSENLKGTFGCMLKAFGDNAYVCVCNSTYCDTVENTEPQKASKGGYSVYQSDNTGNRLVHSYGSASKQKQGKEILVNQNTTFQSIIGFGGAFTDAAGINIQSLSANTQRNLLSSYYSTEGIEYTLGRIPMASCDFSTHPYSYDDTDGDFNLTKFSLAQEDFKYKIPITQAVMKTFKRNLTLFASPWSAPAWMKTNKNMTGKGSLIGQPGGPYFKSWALYFVKFLKAYADNGIPIWGLTGQNEPTDGMITNFPFQAMGWTPEMQRDFIVKDLGPALQQNSLGDVKLMILDDSRLQLPYWAEQVFSSEEARKFVSGIAVHWYQDFVAPTLALSSTHKMFPDKFLLATEACAGSLPWNYPKVALGSWKRGEDYAHDIMQDLNNFVSGWTDWNIALDMEGGPNWVKNFVDSPIIVNAKTDEFYKQPMFYVMGHFSKFILPGSVRIKLVPSQALEKDTQIVGFRRPDKAIVCVLLNKSSQDVTLALRDPSVGYINVDLKPHSIQTVLWWPS